MAEVLADVAADIAADITADITTNITSKTELKARVEIQQLKELKVFNSLKLSIVLLLVICCWNSLKS